jgi:hypothetical protein
VLYHYPSFTQPGIHRAIGVSNLVLGRRLVLRKRGRLVLLILAVKVERLLDLLAEALAIRGLAVAVAAVLLLVNITSSTTLYYR